MDAGRATGDARTVPFASAPASIGTDVFWRAVLSKRLAVAGLDQGQTGFRRMRFGKDDLKRLRRHGRPRRREVGEAPRPEFSFWQKRVAELRKRADA